MKDVVGQKIYYYAINEAKTKSEGIYNEALKKVFDAPIALDALVDAKFQQDTKIDGFGIDSQFKLEVFLHYRDLIDKGIQISVGDFFSFSDIFYEVTELNVMRNIYGMPEHKDGLKLIGTKAREDQFKALLLGPTDIGYPEADAVQTTFHQQRGQETNADGPTGDKRELQKEEILGPPITGAKEISSRGDTEHSGASSFYDDEE